MHKITRRVVLSTRSVQKLPKIVLSLMVFEINDILYFCPNSRWWVKFVKVQICQQVCGVQQVCYKYPGGAKFARNDTISDGFQDDIFHFHQNSRWRLKIGKVKIST